MRYTMQSLALENALNALVWVTPNVEFDGYADPSTVVSISAALKIARAIRDIDRVLTNWCHKWCQRHGDLSPYVGDDGQIYV